MTAARLDGHVLVLLEDDITVVIKEEDHDGRQLGGSTARLGDRVRVGQVDQRLHDGVIRRVHRIRQREGTLSRTVEGSIAVRSDDPILPPEVPEGDVQRLPLTASIRQLLLPEV